MCESVCETRTACFCIIRLCERVDTCDVISLTLRDPPPHARLDSNVVVFAFDRMSASGQSGRSQRSGTCGMCGM